MRTEWEKFIRHPVAWCQEWNDKNGKIEIMKLSAEGEEPPRYAVALWVDGQSVPLSTGVAKTLDQAFKNAINGMQRLAEAF